MSLFVSLSSSLYYHHPIHSSAREHSSTCSLRTQDPATVPVVPQSQATSQESGTSNQSVNNPKVVRASVHSTRPSSIEVSGLVKDPFLVLAAIVFHRSKALGGCRQDRGSSWRCPRWGDQEFDQLTLVDHSDSLHPGHLEHCSLVREHLFQAHRKCFFCISIQQHCWLHGF